MDWKPYAADLAAQVTHAGSRWRGPVAAVPRHLLVPRWFAYGPFARQVVDGPTNEEAWAKAAYRDRTLVTQIGPLHADHAQPGDQPAGRPTSSSTLPSLTLGLFRHALINDGMDVLDVGTGSGYGAALLAERLGDQHVTSIDVDPYLSEAATLRLNAIGLHPTVATVDATGDLPGNYDRIVATVAVRPIPTTWLTALRPGGRLVTTIADTGLLLTADKTPEGGATGRIEWDRAAFMRTRSGADYPPSLSPFLEQVRDKAGDLISISSYPVVQVVEGWELWSTLSVLHPGVEHHYEESGEGRDVVRTAFMLHADGSWARATSRGDQLPEVHQGGPRRLWDLLDDVRLTWLREGSLPVYGARVTIAPSGSIQLRRGAWKATIN